MQRREFLIAIYPSAHYHFRMSEVSPIPEGYHSITPYFIVKGAAKAIDWYKESFGAEELMRMPMGDKPGHAEMQIGTSRIMLADEMDEMNFKSPESYVGTPVGICFYTEDCNAVFNKAVANGAKVVRPLADQFYGDRSGTVFDPFGHQWTISTHIEDLTPEEMDKRMQKVGTECGNPRE